MSSLPLVTNRRLRVRRLTSLGFLLAPCAGRAAFAQEADLPPGTAAIVEQMVARHEERAEDPGAYSSRRQYHIVYRGFPHDAEADMIVNETWNGESSKRFQIVSQSGSALLIRHVLMKLLKTEQDDAANRSNNALTPVNYNFILMGSETGEGRLTYVLWVEPKEPRAFLYRGTIWVDAQDFAVVQIDVKPARNLSFWIRDTEIHHVYLKTGDFWLPDLNRSESKVRLGGTALLTVNYGDYRFVSADAEPPDSEFSSVMSR